MFQLIVDAFAVYGLWVMLGMPKTDAIVALGAKAIAWARSKVQ